MNSRRIQYKLQNILRDCYCSVTQSCPTLCIPWTAAHQASLSFTISWSMLKLMSIESVMSFNHLILLYPSPPAFNLSQHQGFFSNEPAHCIRWLKHWSFSFSITSSNEDSGLISFRIDCFDLLPVQGCSQECSPAPQFESINFLALSLPYGPTLTSIHDYWKKK